MGCNSSKATQVENDLQFEVPKNGYSSGKLKETAATPRPPPPPPAVKPVLPEPPISPLESPATKAATVAESRPHRTSQNNTTIDAAAIKIAIEDPAKPANAVEEQIITGILEKRGAAGTAGANKYKRRFILLVNGAFSYYKSEKDYEKQLPPINQVVLTNYAVMKGEPGVQFTPAALSANPDLKRSFYLAPLPTAPADAKTGAPARVWELRAVLDTDLDDWVACFEEHGCASQRKYDELTGSSKSSVSHTPSISGQLSGAAAMAMPKPTLDANGRPVTVPAGAFSDPSALASATSADLHIADEGSYNAAIVALTADVTSNLMDPATDGSDPYFYAGYLEKRGEGALATYKKRWVVIKQGFMMYYDAETSRKKNAKPNHANYIPLSSYVVVAPPKSPELKLEPVAKSAGRTWELRCMSSHEADRNFWIYKLVQHGAKRGGSLIGNSVVSAGERALPAAAHPEEAPVTDVDPTALAATIGTVAPNGYDYTMAPGIWEMCSTPEGLVYWYHIPSGSSQWSQPTSDALESAQPPAAPSTTAAAAAIQTPASPTATASTAPAATSSSAGAGVSSSQASFLAALEGAELSRTGTLERYHQPKGVLKAAGVFRKHFFELKNGHLCSFENEAAYRNGASVKVGHDLDLTQFILLEALEIVGVGPSYATLLHKNDTGKTLTLQAVDPATTIPVIWQIRCSSTVVRNNWGITLLASGAARPALPEEVAPAS